MSTALRLSAAALVAVALPTGLHAQARPAPPSRAELNPAARARLAPPPPDALAPPAEGPCPLAENPAPLTVTSVTLRGLVSASPQELRPAYAEFLNRPLDASVLCRIRDRVNGALFDRGLLARVEIPAQTITDGAVTFEVIEAHIVNVQVRGDAGPAQAVLEGYAEKLRGMAPFDINRVQRYVLLASDVPGLTVRASVRPDPGGERGAVDLDLDVRRDPQNLIANVQNLQSRATGRWGGLVRGDFNGATRFGEQSSLVLYRTAQNEQWVAQGLEEMRLSSEGLTFRGAVSYGESRPGGAVGPLGLKSQSLVATSELAWPLVRRRRANLALAGGLELVSQQTRLGGAGRLIDDDLRIAYLRVDGDRTFYWEGHPVVLGGQAGVRRGFKGFGASSRGDPLLSRFDARPQAWVAFGQADLLTVVRPRLALHARLEGQYANQSLAAYEEYAAGSLTIGRGYDPAFVTGDSAIAASVELRGGPFPLRAGWPVSPYAFYDVAHVSDHGLGGVAQTIASAGVGAQVPLRGRWLLDVGYAAPLKRRALDHVRPSPRLLVNLTARFF